MAKGPLVKPAVPAPQQDKFEYTSVNVSGCCGAQYVVRRDAVFDRNDEEAMRKRYRTTSWFLTRENYVEEVRRLEARHAGAAAIGSIKRLLERYSFEAWIKEGCPDANRWWPQIPAYSPGLAISNVPLEGFTEAPSGRIWWRRDRAPVNKTSRVLSPHSKPPEGVTPPGFWANYGAFRPSKTPFDDHYHFVGTSFYSPMTCRHYGFAETQPEQWAVGVLQRLEGLAPGTLATCILNHNQRHGRRPSMVGAQVMQMAGFTEVCRTGNVNHPGSSTIYLYEKVV